MQPIEETLKEFDRRSEEENYLDVNRFHTKEECDSLVWPYADAEGFYSLCPAKVRAFIEQALIERDEAWKWKISKALTNPEVSDEAFKDLSQELLDN